MFKKAEEAQIVEWIRKDQLKPLGRYLVSGTVHGKPGIPVAELTRLEKIVAKNFGPDEIYLLGKALLRRPEYTARGLGIGFIESGWPKHPEVEKLLWTAADDEDWIVREFAAGTYARLLGKDFGHFSKLYLKWVRSDSVNIKRAIALAVKYDAKSEDAKRWKTYLALISPLLEEETEYIRKNLGPFAIGDGLLKKFPGPTLAACRKWAKSANTNVRWNAAMVFTAAAARNFAAEGREILSKLSLDAHPAVARAAQKALRNLKRDNFTSGAGSARI
jgi:hypothetical protein